MQGCAYFCHVLAILNVGLMWIEICTSTEDLQAISSNLRRTRCALLLLSALLLCALIYWLSVQSFYDDYLTYYYFLGCVGIEVIVIFAIFRIAATRRRAISNLRLGDPPTRVASYASPPATPHVASCPRLAQCGRLRTLLESYATIVIEAGAATPRTTEVDGRQSAVEPPILGGRGRRTSLQELSMTNDVTRAGLRSHAATRTHAADIRVMLPWIPAVEPCVFCRIRGRRRRSSLASWRSAVSSR